MALVAAKAALAIVGPLISAIFTHIQAQKEAKKQQHQFIHNSMVHLKKQCPPNMFYAIIDLNQFDGQTMPAINEFNFEYYNVGNKKYQVMFVQYGVFWNKFSSLDNNQKFLQQWSADHDKQVISQNRSYGIGKNWKQIVKSRGTWRKKMSGAGMDKFQTKYFDHQVMTYLKIGQSPFDIEKHWNQVKEYKKSDGGCITM